MLSQKAVFFSSLETLPTNSKHIQMYTEIKPNIQFSPGYLFGKRAFLNFVEDRKDFLLPKFPAAFLLFYRVSTVRDFLVGRYFHLE